MDYSVLSEREAYMAIEKQQITNPGFPVLHLLANSNLAVGIPRHGNSESGAYRLYQPGTVETERRGFSAGVAPSLDQDVDHVTVLIDGTPEVVALPADRY